MSFFLLLSISYIKNTSMVREEMVTLKVIFKLIFKGEKCVIYSLAPLVVSFLLICPRKILYCVSNALPISACLLLSMVTNYSAVYNNSTCT